MSLRKSINEKCKDCNYDDLAAGTWLQQITLCSSPDCPLYGVRPQTKSLIPESVLTYHGRAKTGTSQGLTPKREASVRKKHLWGAIPRINTATLQPWNLAKYARKKNLPVDFPEDLGLSNISYQSKPAVKIPYQDANGNEIVADLLCN